MGCFTVAKAKNGHQQRIKTALHTVSPITKYAMKLMCPKPLSLCVFGTAALSGCVLMSTAPATVQSPISFNYQTENGRSIGIEQVFEMNGNTVVQLGVTPISPPLVYDTAGAELRYKQLGQYIMLNGVHPDIRVVVDGRQAAVRRKTQSVAHAIAANAQPEPVQTRPPVAHREPIERPSVPVTTVTPASRPEVDDIEPYRQELARIRRELAEVKNLLAEQARRNSATSPQYASVAPPSSPKQLRVTFKFNSAEFQPAPEIAKVLSTIAPQASRISIRGYTDSEKASENEMTVATNRANSARQYLVKRGVDENRIQISAHAAGGFIADNRTPQGRAQNRRVEIDLL